jgi:hypothetical protein
VIFENRIKELERGSPRWPHGTVWTLCSYLEQRLAAASPDLLQEMIASLANAMMSGHCCVRRWRAGAGCADASSPLSAASAAVQLRRVPASAGGDHRGGALVPALKSCWERGINVDHVTIYRWVQRFTPLLINAARPCRRAAGDRWFVDKTVHRPDMSSCQDGSH